MAVIVDIAEAVKFALDGAVFTEEFTAERGYRPELERDFDGILVTVVPAGITPNPGESTRGGTLHEYQIDIGVQHRYETADVREMDGLMDLAEQIMDFVGALDVRDVHGAKLAAIENNPVYAPEHMQSRVFTSIISATYVVWR